MKLSTTERYSKKEAKFFAKHQELLERYEKVLAQLKEDCTATWLKTHRLKGNLSDYHAVSLTYEYRIVIFIKILDDEIVLVNIGTHDEVYG
jgi:mRNA-degrading endonuclease YafQ of YafQ-DinJ toxin-antitoxin module